MQANDVNIAVHIGMGAGGLICGLWPLLSRKGGVVHRRSGRVFVVMAGMVLGTAILADIFLYVPIALIAVTLSASYQYISSLRSLALRNRYPSTVDAILAIVALIGCAWIVLSKGTGTASWTPAIAYSTAAYVACMALYDLSRPFWAAYWLRRVRPLDHGLKMTGCYFAMLSSGAGNLLKHAQPWSQVIPSSLGIMVMVVFLSSYFGRRMDIPVEV
ncbi:hypothetical protein ISN76_19225 [Dyella halodurans]|uniref:DUF2306 domain-containing protein n=1 Tax=Dyella halodurans TaxID=1920171 RepID=A0ABV9BZZ7_9GAMM|nr:hypothetical protein [Dyella halodurans]